MTKKNITITALAAVLVMSMAAFAVAGPYGKGYGRGGCPGYGAGAAAQLTPEKQAAVDKIIESYTPKFSELRNEMWTKHATLQALVNGGNADEKKIGKLTSELTQLRDQMWDMREKMSAELEKETGIEGFGARGYGRGGCSGGGSSWQGCAGYGGQGKGQGRGMNQTY
jgi:zinc resistance-associated protein